MSAKSATNEAALPPTVSSALDEIRKQCEHMHEDNRNLRRLLKLQQDVIDPIPLGLPDGTGFMSPTGWVTWAKKQLGYGQNKPQEPAL